MNLSDLKRLEKLSNLSSFTENDIITKINLYDQILITTDDIEYVEQDKVDRAPSRVLVSDDVKALHRFMNSTKNIELLCMECQAIRPFKQTKGWNLKSVCSTGKLASTVNTNSSHHSRYSTSYTNHMEGSSLKYNLGEDLLDYVDDSFFYNYNVNQYKADCGDCCKKGILDSASEFRKNFECKMDSRHKSFVDFVILPAMTDSPDELKENYDGPNKAQIKLVEELFYKYRNALILMKVGQYPSLIDLRLLKDEKKQYKKILGDNYKDYLMALSLNEENIGVGSFVYLRRILENLVEEVHQECLHESLGYDTIDEADGNLEKVKLLFDDDKYKHSHFNEKILMLENAGKTIIPRELAGIRGEFYNVISGGVHQLSDQECNELFPDVCLIIEKFLDEKIKQKKEEEHLNKAIKTVQNQKKERKRGIT